MVKCKPMCFRSSEIPKCEDAGSIEVTCRKIQSSNDLPKICTYPSDLQQGCSLITFNLDSLVNDAYFLPYQAELIAGLPSTKKCYVTIDESSANGVMLGTNITYDAEVSISTSSKPIMYSTYGSDTVDCNMQNYDDKELNSCQSATAPLPIRKSAWICS